MNTFRSVFIYTLTWPALFFFLRGLFTFQVFYVDSRIFRTISYPNEFSSSAHFEATALSHHWNELVKLFEMLATIVVLRPFVRLIWWMNLSLVASLLLCLSVCLYVSMSLCLRVFVSFVFILFSPCASNFSKNSI